MKIKILSFAVLMTFLLTGNGAAAAGAGDTLHITFFGSATCSECMRIKNDLLQPLIKKHDGMLVMKFSDIETDTGLKEMITYEKTFNVKSNASQELYFPDTVLCGFEDIMEHGEAMIESRLASGFVRKNGTPLSGDSVDLKKVLRSKTFSRAFFIGTLVTGLIDGINPCAIATMIFLISFMATRKRNRREIVIIGMAYTSTVFITYLAMGLGMKGILEHIVGYHFISNLIRWGACALAAVVAVLSFRDAIVYAKTKKAEEIALQLPKAVKIRIHKIISGNLSGGHLLVGSIITGFLVTLLEAICTGQMYVPYIVAMTQDPSLRTVGILYLIFYNFLFVLPLLIVMILAYFGLKWNDLAKQTQKQMVTIKILLGVIMTALAIYLAIGSGFIG